MKRLNIHIKSLLQWCLLVLLAFSACRKDKLDMEYDNRKVTDARKSSTVRLVNLSGFNQAIVNGDTLTNYVVRQPNTDLSGSYPATPYFRDNGRLNTTWSVPQDLFVNSVLTLKTQNISFSGRSPLTEFVLKEEAQPVDYYLVTSSEKREDGSPLLVYNKVQVPRAVAAPSDPAKFKIRILNLSAGSDDGVENLVGPLTLSWADGTAVSAATTNIMPGKYSEYIELPYGAVQFKVLTAEGFQVSAVAAEAINAGNSTLVSSPNLTYAPVKTYFPGGIYTIVVASQSTLIPYPGSSTGETITAYQNVFRIISDISEPANLTYSRLQGVNVMPGMDGVKITLNGEALGAALDYAAHSDYKAYITGNYKAEAWSASGVKLAETDLNLEANKNFSLWFYPGTGGVPAIKAVANDLSGTWFGLLYGEVYAYQKQAFPVNVRFLNFCQDVPYLTVTGNDGALFNGLYPVDANAVNNLTPGAPPVSAPYLMLRPESGGWQFMAFRSAPGIVPGTWAKEIPVLTGQNLISRPELYVRTGLPNHEAGIYSVALIGSTKPNTPEAQKAKMVILKHNK